ncbi:polyamine-modulated factor 1-like protein [Lates japonicus]|uniref:Polyamine-modulated factor 1-like protein n=1 Tax=Lates japonicus TaxID=270547 RepID=A0AAD3RFT1_LATJO|nr:polyamine-modulated factor 1-like protein [Lates japonicus]
MEESEVATQKETVVSTCVRDSAENQSNEATGEVSNPAAAAACKPAKETGARFNRLKLLDKVMQKSLEKFIDIARRPSGVPPEQDLCRLLMPYYQKQEAYMLPGAEKDPSGERWALHRRFSGCRGRVSPDRKPHFQRLLMSEGIVTEFETLASSLPR